MFPKTQLRSNVVLGAAMRLVRSLGRTKKDAGQGIMGDILLKGNHTGLFVMCNTRGTTEFGIESVSVGSTTHLGGCCRPAADDTTHRMMECVLIPIDIQHQDDVSASIPSLSTIEYIYHRLEAWYSGSHGSLDS